MKLFECADGRLVNPEMVTNCYHRKVENKYIAVFKYPCGDRTEIMFDRATYAEGEIKAFRQHCEEN